MGATGWKYVVPYQQDIAAALEQLRNEVFSRGEYIRGEVVSKEALQTALNACGSNIRSDADDFAAKAADASLPESTRRKFAMLAEQFRQLENPNAKSLSPPTPRTISELLEMRAESGTHSILDTPRISQTPQFGSISPLAKEKTIEIFGSETPSRDEIERAYRNGVLEGFIPAPWHGIYVIAYADSRPSEIFFVGRSGD